MDVFVLSEFDGAEAFVFASKADAIASVRMSYSKVASDLYVVNDGPRAITVSYDGQDGVTHVAARILQVPLRTEPDHL